MSSISNILFWLTVFFASFYILIFYLSRIRLYYYGSKIDGPLAFPLIGSAYILMGSTDEVLIKGDVLMKKYNPFLKIWAGSVLCVAPSEPEDIEIIMTTALEKSHFYKFIKPTFGNGLFTSPVIEWKKNRKTIAAMFTPRILNSFLPICAHYSNKLVKRFEESSSNEYNDMFAVLSECTLDITCSTVMGLDVNAMEKNCQLLVWIARLSEISIIRGFTPYLHFDFVWRFTSSAKESNEISKTMDDYVRNVIEEKRQTIKTSNDYQPNCILDHLITLTDQEEKWSNQRLQEEIRTLIIAGSDAPAVAVCHVLLMLGLHQDIQDRVYEELCSILEDETALITLKDLSKMTYMERVIKESIRILPVATGILRELTNDLQVRDTFLPKTTTVLINIYHLHRNPKFWPNPLKFDPDRFLPENVANRHPYAYIPFSGGLRGCLGYKFGMMMVKTMLSEILKKYVVGNSRYKSIEDIKLKADIASKCVGGYHVKLERRKTISK